MPGCDTECCVPVVSDSNAHQVVYTVQVQICEKASQSDLEEVVAIPIGGYIQWQTECSDELSDGIYRAESRRVVQSAKQCLECECGGLVNEISWWSRDNLCLLWKHLVTFCSIWTWKKMVGVRHKLYSLERLLQCGKPFVILLGASVSSPISLANVLVGITAVETWVMFFAEVSLEFLTCMGSNKVVWWSDYRRTKLLRYTCASHFRLLVPRALQLPCCTDS